MPQDARKRKTGRIPLAKSGVSGVREQGSKLGDDAWHAWESGRQCVGCMVGEWRQSVA